VLVLAPIGIIAMNRLQEPVGNATTGAAVVAALRYLHGIVDFQETGRFGRQAVKSFVVSAAWLSIRVLLSVLKPTP